MREPFEISVWDYFKINYIYTFFDKCIKKDKKILLKHAQYKQGLKKIKRDFEITSLLRQMKENKLMAHIFLPKYQRALVEFFYENVLDEKIEDEDNRTTEQKELMKQLAMALKEKQKQRKIKQYVFTAYMAAQQNKTDQRILKKLLSPKNKYVNLFEQPKPVSGAHVADMHQSNKGGAGFND